MARLTPIVAAPAAAPPRDVAHWLRPGTLQLPSLPPLAVYVHLPWCLRKCPYCDFNSHEVAAPPRSNLAGAPHAVPGGASASARTATALDDSTQARYLDALRADLEASLPLVWGRSVSSVFIGGGTPSLFSPDAIDRLLSDLRACLPLEPGCEVTLEANPGAFERERFHAYRAAGVTRLSIGVQSFDDALLARIGRVHDGAQARAAVEEAAAAFDTFNLDLMYALPGQTPGGLQRDLDAALSYRPPHLSVYHLTVEPNTRFAAAPPSGLPDDDAAAAMLDAIAARTSEHSLQRYEVSAFARPGHRCVHNVNYWRYGDYLGLGAGAHGKISFPHRVVRQVRWREPAAYMRHALAGCAVSNEHEVPRADLPFEFMLNALRLRDGFELSLFTERTGLPASVVEPVLAQAATRGLVSVDGRNGGAHVRPTEHGFDFLSDLQAMFLGHDRKR